MTRAKSCGTAFQLMTIILVVACSAISHAIEFRTIDGTGNNVANPTYGSADSELVRLLDNAYDDGFDTPRGGLHSSTLASARHISNLVAAQPASVPNFLGASDWLWQWGQFIDHDLDFTPGTDAEAFHVSVPKFGDPDFNPGQLDNIIIPFTRSLPVGGTGTAVNNPREQRNEITSYLDASMIYGSDSLRAFTLRDDANMALLETSIATNGEVLPMKNTGGLPNDNGGSIQSGQFFLSGDVRANEQIGLTAAHSLFVREHNRLATELSSRLNAGEPALVTKLQAAVNDTGNGVNSEDDFLYEAARKIVGAQVQKITYEEFLPLLIGNDLGAYSGYDSSVDASISNEFATAAYRVGHTMLSSSLQRPGIGAIALKDAFFNPNEVEQNGVDAVLHGLAMQQAQEIDNMVIDGVRNFLFGPPGAGGLDLASLNIQRGRDHGLPGYVETYNELFGTANDPMPITSFIDLGSAGLGLFEDSVVALLEQAYTSVDEIDLWIGGISELPDDHGGLLGPTFTFFIADQFGRTRDGDRFFYADAELDAHLQVLDPEFESTLLSDIILRNTTIAAIQDNVFVAVPEPRAMAILMAICLVGTSLRSR